MALEISTTQATGMTLAATIERLSDGYFWNPVAVAFQSAPAWADKYIALTPGASENAGTYTVSVASLGNAGACRVRIHDTGSSNATIAAGDVYILSGDEVKQTGDSYPIVSSGTHGNAALKGLIDTVDTVADGIATTLGAAGAGLTGIPKTGYKLASDGIDLILCADGVTLWKNATVHGAVVLMGVTAGAGSPSETFTKYGYVVTSTNDGTNRTATSVA